jgi:hypothetical protein
MKRSTQRIVGISMLGAEALAILLGFALFIGLLDALELLAWIAAIIAYTLLAIYLVLEGSK